MDQAAVARHRLEAVEARTHSLCRAATLRRRPGPGGANRRQPTWSMAARKQPRAHHCYANRLLRFTRPAVRRQTANRINHRTAVYGPVRTVVWEGRSREAPPYPDWLRFKGFPNCHSGSRARRGCPESRTTHRSWIPGSRASPAPRNDESNFGLGIYCLARDETADAVSGSDVSVAPSIGPGAAALPLCSST